MLRFTVLGSGSTGNSTLIEASDGHARRTRVLVDCGLTTRELARRLAMRDVGLDHIDAVFVTHEHSDHIGCLRTLVRKHRVTVWTSEGTWRGAGLPFDGPQRSLFDTPRRRDIQPPPRFARAGDVIRIGALELRCFAVPHDAAEPLQVVASDGDRKLGIATDLGTPDLMVMRHLQGVHALMLESNHDEDMLAEGPYPFFLKRRIGGDFGHLGNAQAGELLRAVAHSGLEHVVAAHLSRHNNLPSLAAEGFAAVLDRRPSDIHVADPVAGTGWLRV